MYKSFLVPEVRKSVPKLVFARSAFDFDFLDLAKFAIVDRFLIFLPIQPLSALPAAFGAS